MKRWLPLVMCLGLAVVSSRLVIGQTAAIDTRNGRLSADTRQKLLQSLGRGATYLRQQQRDDGIWENHPGITGMAATALLRQPGTTPAAQMAVVGKSLDALAKLAKPDGGIYENAIPHYITAVSVMTFVAGGRPQDK